MVQYIERYIFTFVHLADTFIHSDLHCISRYTFSLHSYQFLLSLGIKPM